MAYYANQTVNGLGEPTQYSLGNNGLSVTKTYTNGQPTNFSTTPNNIQNISMTWANAGLDLINRADNNNVTNEHFEYDGLFRLTLAQPSPNPSVNVEYDNHSGTSRGDLEKDDVAAVGVSNFNYWVHELSSVRISPPTPVVATTQQNQQSIQYTGFRQPASIIEGTNELDFTSYDANYQRKSTQLLQNGVPTETREYYGDWERITNTAAQTDYVVNYIGGGDGICALSVIDISGCNITGPITVTITPATRSAPSYVTINNNCQVTPVIYYVYKDHLGSFLTITDDQGNIQGQQSFDAWGRMRNPADWSYNLTNTNYTPMPSWMTRGFTGQEQLPLFNLINLNARLYDPIMGRMLGPDENIQDPNFTQDYNSYTYARNNPLKYTDPSGNVYQIQYDNPLNTNNNSNQQLWEFAIGLAAGGIGGAVGDYIGGAVGAIAGGAVTGFIGGAGNALVGGANIGQALTAGAETGGLATLSAGIGVGLSYGMNGWSSWGNGEVYSGSGEFSGGGSYGGAGGNWSEYSYTKTLSESDRYNIYMAATNNGQNGTTTVPTTETVSAAKWNSFGSEGSIGTNLWNAMRLAFSMLIPKSSSYAAITLSGTLVGVSGYQGSVSMGFVGIRPFISATGGVAYGSPEVGLSFGVTTGTYIAPKGNPDVSSTFGYGNNYSMGLNPTDLTPISASHSYGLNGYKGSPTWEFYNMSLGIGTSGVLPGYANYSPMTYTIGWSPFH